MCLVNLTLKSSPYSVSIFSIKLSSLLIKAKILSKFYIWLKPIFSLLFSFYYMNMYSGFLI